MSLAAGLWICGTVIRPGRMKTLNSLFCLTELIAVEGCCLTWHSLGGVFI
jgi:hypothetical protein